MCYFVMVAFRQDAMKIARGLLRSACRMRLTDNPSVATAIPPAWAAAYLADEMCGCDMYAAPEDVAPGSDCTALRGLRIDVRRLLAELARSLGEVRVLVHFFSGSVDDETINADTEDLDVERFMADDSVVLPDVWYQIGVGQAEE